MNKTPHLMNPMLVLSMIFSHHMSSSAGLDKIQNNEFSIASVNLPAIYHIFFLLIVNSSSFFLMKTNKALLMYRIALSTLLNVNLHSLK